MKTLKNQVKNTKFLRLNYIALFFAFIPCTMFISSCDKDEELFPNEEYVEDTNQETNNETTNSNATKYEKPDIGFYDYTAGYTTLKVKYKIYNKDEAKVSTAKIQLGTSASKFTTIADATVSGSTITAYFRGLKKGTTYYVKCTATGKGGTTSTKASKLMTN